MLSPQVTIVGAGPVGLLSAIALDAQGVSTVVVEKHLARQSAPKAHAVNPRTLEICQRFGISASDIRAAGASIEEGGQVHFVDRLNSRCFGSLPYERQDEDAKAHTPWPLINIAQPRFEQFLEARYSQCTRSTLMRGFIAQRTVESDAHITTDLHCQATEQNVSITSDYVIAADGASSTIRDQLGINMVGPEAIQHYIMIHFESDLRELTKANPGLLYFCMQPDASGVFIGYQRDQSWVFMHSYNPAAESRADFSPERCQAIVEAAAGEALPEFRVQNISAWAMSAQVAERYQSGRAFLVGDAAHRFPPTGGLGLNTGVGDAHNLTWKLAKVLKDAAPSSLLASYDRERRPVAEINSQQSLMNSAKLMHLFGALYGVDPAQKETFYADVCKHPENYPEVAAAVEIQRPHFDSFNLQLGYRYGVEVDANDIDISVYVPRFEVGNYLPHTPLQSGGWLLEQLPNSGYSLVAGPKGDAWQSADLPCFVEDEHFSTVECAFHTRANISADGALLIRPDGHIAARWTTLPERHERAVADEIQQSLGG